MRRPLLLLLLLLAPACDWEHYALMNSVPVKGDPAHNPVVHVYLGLDGLGHAELSRARALGAFAGPQWSLARFIPIVRTFLNYFLEKDLNELRDRQVRDGISRAQEQVQ